MKPRERDVLCGEQRGFRCTYRLSFVFYSTTFNLINVCIFLLYKIQYHSQIHDCYINWRPHLTRFCASLAVTTNYRKLKFINFAKSLRNDAHFKFRENPSRASRYKRQTLGQFRYCTITFSFRKKRRILKSHKYYIKISQI